MNIRGDRGKFAPQGNLGGGPGSCARYILNPRTENETILGSKTGGGRIRKGERLRVMTPGGDGTGDPAGRRPTELDDHQRTAKVQIRLAPDRNKEAQYENRS